MQKCVQKRKCEKKLAEVITLFRYLSNVHIPYGYLCVYVYLQVLKLPVLNLLTCQKSGFSSGRGDSLHRFMSNLAVLTGTCVRLACKISPQSPQGVGGNAAPKYQKIPLSGKESPVRGDSLDRFRTF